MPKTPVIRTPYDGLPSADEGIKCTAEESMTVQAHLEFCDIEKNLALAGVQGIGGKPPVYGDMTQVPNDLHSAHEFMQRMNEDFLKHTPAVRARFENSPYKLATFLLDKANLEESYKLGLRVKPVQEVKKEEPKKDAVSPDGEKTVERKA